MSKGKKIQMGSGSIRLLFIAILVLIIGLRNSNFLTYTNLIDVLNEASILAIIASGMMLVMMQFHGPRVDRRLKRIECIRQRRELERAGRLSE